MAVLSAILAALLANGAVALPQGGLIQLIGAGLKPGGLGHFMGELAATEALTDLAKLFGATRTAPGGLQLYTANVMNGTYI
jgi:hypothetical protein